MQVLPLNCRALVVPVVEEGWICVGLIRTSGCGGIVSLVGSHVQRSVAGWAECSSCSGDWRQAQLCFLLLFLFLMHLCLSLYIPKSIRMMKIITETISV